MFQLQTRKFKKSNNKEKVKLMNKRKIRGKFKDQKKQINSYKKKSKIKP